MAIIKIGPPLSGIRGTVGGITYSENGSGPYAKLWAPPVNTRSPKQYTERGFLARMPALWIAMTNAQRAAWRTFAADPAQELTNPLGEAYYASGYNWFCKCNVRLLRVGRTPIVPVPTQARPAAPTIDDFRVCVAGSESDICIGGAVTASSQDAPFVAANAFDDNLGTFWSTPAGTTTGWLQYVLTGAANVKRYRMFARTLDTNAGPADWTFQVWSAAAWQTIHTVTSEVWAPTTWYDYYCPNAFTETTYRINITQNQGHANRLQIVEMEYYLADEGASVVCYPEDNFDDAPDYDLVLHVAMGNSIGMGVQYPGFYEILAQQSPGRWYALFQSELEAVFGTIQEARSWYARLYRQTREGLRSAAQTERTETIEV